MTAVRLLYTRHAPIRRLSVQIDGSWRQFATVTGVFVPVSYRTKANPSTLLIDWVAVSREKHYTHNGTKLLVRPGTTIASNQFEGLAVNELFGPTSALVNHLSSHQTHHLSIFGGRVATGRWLALLPLTPVHQASVTGQTAGIKGLCILRNGDMLMSR
jgi:hypothetical protein